MKRVMFLLLVAGLFTGLCSVACNKSSGASAGAKDATITGFDQRACPCCGGLMITFNGETKPYVQPYFLVENDAASLGIDANGSFPIAVKVAYEKLAKCNQAFVRVKRLVRR